LILVRPNTLARPAQTGGRVIVAGDARVHQAALEMLKG
jgi:hypothetical protein